ncbi:MAG TPA: ferrochelatase [Candidatus Kapabacteria bacterium]|nr:ferrochelatase [Candidatus Kapabacteria bacterium]
MPERPTAIVLLQFGGPDSLDAVQPFLYNLFNDPDIFQLPLLKKEWAARFGEGFQRLVARTISKRRAKVVRDKYHEIGGKSPIVERTEEQVRALQRYFEEHHPELKTTVRLAARYWHPLTTEVMESLLRDEIRDVVLLPLYPQYSIANAGSSFNEWDREAKRLNADFHERKIREYYKSRNYIAAINARIDESLSDFAKPEKVFLLFSAHGTPMDMVKRGDPYSEQIRETMELVMSARNHDKHYTLSFQSKVGPKKWLTPSTHDTLIKLGNLGITDMLVIPIAFVSDHIETLHELNIEERLTAEGAGMKHYRVMKGLNDHPLFIECMANMALTEIHALQHE